LSASPHVLSCEHDGKPLGALRPLDAVEPGEIDFQHVSVQEEEGTQRLFLGGGGNLPVDR